MATTMLMLAYQHPMADSSVASVVMLYNTIYNSNCNVMLFQTHEFWFFWFLAGNFNGNPSDDNLKPDNIPASNTNELGESWQVPDPRPE